VLAATYGLIAMVPNYVALFPLKVLLAASQAAYGTASLALMGDLLERSKSGRGRRMGTFRGLSSFGFGLMAFTSGTIADRLSLRMPFFLAAGFALAALVLVLRIEETPTEADATGNDPSKSLRLSQVPAFIWGTARDTVAAVGGAMGQVLVALRERAGNEVAPSQSREADRLSERGERLPLAPLLISALLWSLVTGAVYAVWANYMVHEVGFSRAHMTRLWAVASLSELPLMILAGWLSDRIGRLPMLSLGFVAWTAVFMGYVFVPVMPWIIVVQLTRGFAYSAFTATAMTYATEVRARSQRGEIAGIYSSAGGIGSIVGASVGGALTQFMGFRVMFTVMAGLILAGAIYTGIMAVRCRAVAPPKPAPGAAR
jgi:MFS family permease